MRRTAPLLLKAVTQTTPKGVSVNVLTMEDGPVNILTRQLLKDLISAIAESEAAPNIRGLLITSARPAFCAGLDITELHNAGEDKLRSYWELVQKLWLRLWRSRLAVVSAINGPAPAGALILACASDFRVVVDNPKAVTGLSESQLGLVAPSWLAESFVSTLVSRRRGELFLQKGVLLPPKLALEEGLVDAVVAAEELMPRAISELDALLSVPDSARHPAKLLYRDPLATKLASDLKHDADIFVKTVLNPVVQSNIGDYLEKLRQSSKAKAA